MLLAASTLAACSQTQDMTAPSRPAPASIVASAGQAGKTDVCHVDGKGGFQLLSISSNALQSHLNHGDALPHTGNLTIPAGATYSASNTWTDRGPISNGFDGNPNTEWNAGGAAPQWIEINFGSPQVITGMTGLIDLLPDGFNNHDVTFDGVPVFSWTGDMVNGQLLSYTFATPQTVQTVRITTTAGDSWTAWVDILFQTNAGC
jgi:hypothetical protein